MPIDGRRTSGSSSTVLSLLYMTLQETGAMIVRTPIALWLLLLVPLFVMVWRWWGRRVALAALAVRLAAVALVILALADPAFARVALARQTLVVLADQSDSLGSAGKAALLARAQQIKRDADPSIYAATHILLFGGNQVVPDSAVAMQLASEATDLAAALDAARGLIVPGTGHVVLLSDGGQTRGDALAAAAALAQQQITVDTVAYVSPGTNDAWLASVSAPPTLRVGEEFRVDVTVGSSGSASGELRLTDGVNELASQMIELAPGEQHVAFTTRAKAEGVLRLMAQINVQPDQVARNNQAAATALVARPPRVLLIEGRGGGSAPLRVGLRAAGVESQVIAAQSLPAQLSLLDGFDGAVLIDVPASDMSLDQMAALREFVRSDGRGLVVTGGRSSFTLGAYKGTPLEEVLPVQMDPPPRPQRADVSMLLIIDRSASMGGSSPSKFDMAKEAALLATESLRDEDRLGVLTFDTGTEWAVPFQQLGTGLSLADIQSRIGAIEMGGGTDILAALQAGLPELAVQPGKVRHAVLLTDGRSFTNEYPQYRTLVEQARQQNITLSAIAIGEDADTELLQNLAQWGAGRYHFAATPDDIPRLTMLESEIARTEPQVEGDFRAIQSAAHPLLRDFPANLIPNLAGYVATTLKPQAELVLKSPEDDPVLSVWQYGLGRAVAWTPSIAEPWAPNWANWPDYGQFWAEIVRYTLPEPDSGLTQLRIAPHGDDTQVTVDALAPGGATFDLANTQANVTLPDGSKRAVDLRQTGPGRYAESLHLPTDGAYIFDVVQRKQSETRTVSAGYVQPYPAEYLPVRDGGALLAQISALTSGTPIDMLNAPGTAQPARASSAETARFGFAPWLLLLAALLWPLEIALRRGWFGGR